MLLAPNVGENEPSNVREGWNFGLLLLCVIGPDIGDHEFHVVGVITFRVEPCDWEIGMYFNPLLHGFSKHVFI